MKFEWKYRYQWVDIILACLLAFLSFQVSRLNSRVNDLEIQTRNERIVTEIRLKALEARVHVGVAR